MCSDEQANLSDRLMMNLRGVIDPEIGINIVDLGLIYGISIDASKNVILTLTLTAPNCPFGDMILMECEFACKSVEEVNSVKLDLTFDPPWTPDRVSEEAKYQMGLL